MAERFRKAARRVSILQSAVSALKDSSSSPSSQAGDQKVAPTTRRKSLLGSFKTAVEKVKLKKRITTAFIEPEFDPKEFRTVFNLVNDHRKKLTVIRESVDEEKSEHLLRDLPDMSDREVADFTARELAGRVIESPYFRFTILFLIIVNSVLIAVETDKYMEREYGHIFKLMDQIIMTVFICEILLKWYHSFADFWKQGWNVLDFLIVISLIIGPLVMTNTSGGRGVLRILRVLRAFRSLRSISSLPGLQVVVQTIMQSVPDMTNIVLLLVIIMLVFSVIGITLFRDILPEHFGDLSTAMFSLFICVTQDGWMEIFEAFQQQGETYYYGGGLFLVLFISIGAFIFANLVVAVVVTNLECAVKDIRKEEQLQAKQLAKADHEADEKDVHISRDEIPQKVFQEQTPLITPTLSGIDVRNIENYFLVLGAMEENLQVYQQLKKDLIRFHDEICVLNKSALDEGVITYDDEIAKKIIKKKENEKEVMSFQKAVASGDIMSNLMDMEGANLISTRAKNKLHDVVTDSVTIHAKFGSVTSSNNIAARRRRTAIIGAGKTTADMRRRSSLGF